MLCFAMPITSQYGTNGKQELLHELFLSNAGRRYSYSHTLERCYQIVMAIRHLCSHIAQSLPSSTAWTEIEFWFCSHKNNLHSSKVRLVAGVLVDMVESYSTYTS